MTHKSRTTAPRQRLGRLPAAEGRQKMAEVLRVARDHFGRFGYQGATVEAIAVEAGVTKRTIYAWYTDKLSLLLACIQDGALQLTTPRVIPSQDHGAALRTYGAELLNTLVIPASVGLALMFFRDGRDIPALAASMRTALDEYMREPVAAYLRRTGMQAAPANAHAAIFLSMLLGDLQRRLLLGDPLPSARENAEYSALVVSIFLSGVGISQEAPPREAPALRAKNEARNRKSARLG